MCFDLLSGTSNPKAQQHYFTASYRKLFEFAGLLGPPSHVDITQPTGVEVCPSSPCELQYTFTSENNFLNLCRILLFLKVHQIIAFTAFLRVVAPFPLQIGRVYFDLIYMTLLSRFYNMSILRGSTSTTHNCFCLKVGNDYDLVFVYI